MLNDLNNPKDPQGLISEVSRRDFLKTTGLGVVALPVAVVPALAAQSAATATTTADRQTLIAALGDTLIPDEPDDPGYASLEAYNITAEVMKGLTALRDDDLALFNRNAAPFFGGKTFLELDEPQRGEYLRLLIDGSRFSDKQLLGKLQSVYRLTRIRVMVVYYQNYPEHRLPRDKSDVPMLPASDLHQITNPNTTRLYTGWDRAAYHGPLTWEEEERRRNYFKKLDWQE
jgi:hypothetical protein